MLSIASVLRKQHPCNRLGAAHHHAAMLEDPFILERYIEGNAGGQSESRQLAALQRAAQEFHQRGSVLDGLRISAAPNVLKDISRQRIEILFRKTDLPQ